MVINNMKMFQDYDYKKGYCNVLDTLTNVNDVDIEDALLHVDKDTLEDKSFHTNITAVNVHIDIEDHDFDSDETFEYLNKYAAIYKAIMNELNVILDDENLINIIAKRYNVTAFFETRTPTSYNNICKRVFNIASLSKMINKICSDYHYPNVSFSVGVASKQETVIPYTSYISKQQRYMVLGDVANFAIDASVYAAKTMLNEVFDKEFFNRVKDYIQSLIIVPLEKITQEKKINNHDYVLLNIINPRFEQFIKDKLFDDEEHQEKTISEEKQKEISNQDKNITDDDDISTF